MEIKWWPEHIIPIVHVYNWVGDSIPDKEIIRDLKVLPQFYVPTAYKKFNDNKIMYRLALLNTSKRIIPKNNLFYIGNLQDKELSNSLINESSAIYHCGWKDFERYIIDNYFTWRHIDIKYLY